MYLFKYTLCKVYLRSGDEAYYIWTLSKAVNNSPQSQIQPHSSQNTRNNIIIKKNCERLLDYKIYCWWIDLNYLS